MTTVNGKSMITVGNMTPRLAMRDVLQAAQAEGVKSSHLPSVNWGRKIGRNEPCPCHSGKKFKKCCIDK